MKDQPAQRTHEQVQQAYRKAIQSATRGGCCSSPGETAETLSRYQPEHAALAEQVTSFGCGDPLAFAEVKPGQTVLDLGSGAGLDLLLASQKVGPKGHVIGVDMTEAMLDVARQNLARAQARNVEVRRGFIEDLPVDSESVDWVISNCVINLSPAKDKVFGELFRVLRPGGRFSISDIVVEDLPAWIRDNVAAYAACVAGAIPEREYLAGLVGAGLVDVRAAERLTYDREQLVGLLDEDLKHMGIDPELVQQGLDLVVGKVSSVKFVGRRPDRA